MMEFKKIMYVLLVLFMLFAFYIQPMSTMIACVIAAFILYFKHVNKKQCEE